MYIVYKCKYDVYTVMCIYHVSILCMLLFVLYRCMCTATFLPAESLHSLQNNGAQADDSSQPY